MRTPFIALLLAATATAQTTAIVGATVFSATGTPPYAATVLLKAGRIEAVGPNLQVPPGATVIHAEGQSLIPGLFDLHTHLTASPTTGTPADWPKAAKAYLLNGITTLNEFGTYPETYAPERALLPTFPAPHVNFAARITTPGGHGAEAGRGDFFSFEVLTPREGRAAIDRALPYHPDVIKIFTDGWRYGVAPDMTSMEEATIAAIAAEAHKHNLPVLTHTLTLARAKMAARAEVDVIAHGIQDQPLDSELLGLLKQHGTTYVPTLAVFEPKGERAGKPSQRWDLLLRSIATMHEAGIPIALGTDAGMPGTPHGTASLHELELLVKGGLTPTEALEAATIHSARALRVAGDRGTIEPGKRADLVLLEGAPWRDITAIRNTRAVFLDGVLIDRDRLAREIAAPGPTPLPVLPVSRLIDDFEAPAGRTALNTFRIENTDPGHDHSQVLFLTTPRTATDHALTITGHMSEKDKPYARILLPLSPGSVQPVNTASFQGIQFEARGDGAYTLLLQSRTGTISLPFTADSAWHTVKLPFRMKELVAVGFELARAPGEKVWLELDNVAFY